MEIKRIDRWTYYLGKGYEDLEYEPCVGKWLIFTKQEKAREMCEKAISRRAVVEAKHSDDENAVCCFYIVEDDIKGHEKFLKFCLENDYLPKNKNGTYTNIAIKLDFETELNNHGIISSPSTHLSNYIDLKTGEWTDSFKEKKKEFGEEKKIAKLVAKYHNTFEGNRWSNGFLTMKKGDKLNVNLIKEKMDAMGITIEQLAEKLDVSPSRVKSWLKGKGRPYTWNAMAICMFLKLSPDDVIVQETLH